MTESLIDPAGKWHDLPEASGELDRMVRQWEVGDLIAASLALDDAERAADVVHPHPGFDRMEELERAAVTAKAAWLAAVADVRRRR